MRLLFDPTKSWTAHETWLPFSSPLLESLALQPVVNVHSNHIPPYVEDDVIRVHFNGHDQLTLTNLLEEERVSWVRAGQCEVYNGTQTPHHVWVAVRDESFSRRRSYRDDAFWLDPKGLLIGSANYAAVTVDDEEAVGRLDRKSVV